MADDTLRLLSLLSHELRGPLGVIRGYLRLLTHTEDSTSEQSRQAIAASLRASDRLAELIDQASFLSQLDRGDITIAKARLPLWTIVHAAVQATELPEASSVNLDAAAVPSVTLDVDEARLAAALATFIAAVARAQPSPVTVEVAATRARLGGKPAARLRISPTTISRLETKETELHLARGGMGLALPVAAAIVAAHRGRVRELREGDRNAGFVVTLLTAREGS